MVDTVKHIFADYGTVPVSPHGGYRNLLTYRKAAMIFEGTACFTRRFLHAGDRTVDQMIQAARSGNRISSKVLRPPGPARKRN